MTNNSPPAPRRTAIKQRILTALVALPLLIALVGWGSAFLFSCFITLVTLVGLLELNRMGLGTSQQLEQALAALLGALCIPILHSGRYELLLPWAGVSFILMAFLFLFRFTTIDGVQLRYAWLCLGWFYLPLLLGHLVVLRQSPFGRRWIFLTLITVMLCDSFAYFYGRAKGKRKLYPTVSPNKSVEGGIAGVVGAVVAVLLCKFTFLPMIGLFQAVAIGFILSLLGQGGDLFESLLKRACGVKDSGNLIPGHGGLLDRLDSLLFTFPVVFYIAHYGFGG